MWKYELKQERRIRLWQKWQRKSFLQKSWTIRADAFIALLLPCSIFVVVRFLFVGTQVVFEDPKKKIGTMPWPIINIFAPWLFICFFDSLFIYFFVFVFLGCLFSSLIVCFFDSLIVCFFDSLFKYFFVSLIVCLFAS